MVHRSMPPFLSAAAGQARRPRNVLLRLRAVSNLTTPHHIDDYLEMVDATWCVRGVRARVVGVRRETADAVSVLLRPNENWRGFRAGQFVELSVRTAGVRHTRCFSLSSAPEDSAPLRITIQTTPGGRVSTWARSPACRGGVVELSQARGSFVLPDPPPRKLLFLTGGSGITPIMSMLRHLAAIGYDGDVACLHYARHEVIFGDELRLLAARFRDARLSLRLTRTSHMPGAVSRFSRGALEAFAPDWAKRETFLCGPAPLSHAVTALWGAEGVADQLHLERFALAPERAVSGVAQEGCRLVFAKSRQEASGRFGVPLLEQAESAGLWPVHGCRMGICHICTCRKVSGTVRNALTGTVSSEPDEDIQLCISTPRSDVTLDL
jgi:stearoyl-CoA 9-desaturase NADPH oxidoreductase